MSREKIFKNEKDVKSAVRAILDDIGCFYFMPPSNAFGRAGISDFIGLHRGHFFAIETKFGSNKPTALQLKFGEAVNKHGGFFFVINETNVQDVWKVGEM